MSGDMINIYHSLMQEEQYEAAGNLVLENLDELLDSAMKHHKQIVKSKDPQRKKSYQTNTPGELMMVLDL